ncbi:MAG: MFS transporter [Propionibacteriaceae bacterium]
MRQPVDPPIGPVLWRQRNFRTYWAGGAVSEVGDRVSELAIPLIAITVLHVSPTMVGLLTAAIWAPNLLSVFIGAWVDQQPSKRRLLVAANLLQGLTIASLPVAHLLGGVSLVQLFAVAVVNGFAGVVCGTANATFFAHLVPRSRYVEANSLISSTRSLSFVAGPAAGGALIQAVTAPVAMVVDSVSFLVAAAALGRLRVEERASAERAPGGMLRQAAGGLRLLRRHPYLRPALCCVTTLNFFSFVVQAIIVLYASRTLGLSPGAIGLALALGAVGGFLGAVTAGRAARRFGTGITIAIGAVAFAAPFAALPLAVGASHAGKIAVLAGVEFVSAAAVMWFDVNLNALQTAVIPDGMRSRVAGAFSTVNYGIRPLGAVIGGVSAQVFGIAPTVVVAAVGGSLAVLWLLGTPILATRTLGDLADEPQLEAPARRSA